MSDSLLETLSRSLDQNALQQMGQHIGADHETTVRAVSAAIPSLIAGLSRNASNPQGAEALHHALSRDHDGSIMDDLAGYLGRSATGNDDTSNRMLGHIFGGKQSRVERGVSQVSGLNSGSTTKLMSMLAPIVLGALGRQRKDRGFNAGGLAELLGRERASAESSHPQEMGFLGRMLDSDGDGDFDAGDVLKLGTGFLGKMFTGRG